MKILIGTPIHICKDYAIERWLENVAKLQQQTPADLLLVDNSPDHTYAEVVKRYCDTCGLKNYRIEHFTASNDGLSDAGNRKVEIAQELIRREALKGKYDAWFSWECDQLIPATALDELIRLMQSERTMMVVHNSWARTDPTELNANMGCTLIGSEAFERGWFLQEKDGDINFTLSDSYRVDETSFRKRVVQHGGNYIEAFGIVGPIYHLDTQ